MRRAAVLAALLGVVACTDPVQPDVPPARFCGVALIRTPFVVGGVRYIETLIVPRPCPDSAGGGA